MNYEQAYQWLHGDRVEYSGCRAAAEAMEAEVLALRKDAERYRWLRDNPWPPELEADILLHRNARWDAEIDAAMAARIGAV